MNLYLLTQTESKGWDSIRACVVCAESEEEAIKIHPYSADDGKERNIHYDEDQKTFINNDGRKIGGWAKSLDAVNVQMIGVASPDLKVGAILGVAEEGSFDEEYLTR